MHMILVFVLDGLSQCQSPALGFRLGLDSDTCAEINHLALPTLPYACNINQLLHCIGFYSRVFVLFLF